ncbi:MAG: anti-sigma factor [Bryobacteraceae bacterium]
MTCADCELLICDYVEGALPGPAREGVERHIAECPACAELARDGAAAVAFMDRAADVDPPPELITRILFDPPWAKPRGAGEGLRSRLRAIWHPLLQPRLAMGMAMTILSFAMLAKFVKPVRQLNARDLQPAAVWAALDDRVYRTWQRTVKFYESLKLVYQIQSTVREWEQQQEEQRPAEQDRGARPDDRKLSVKPPAATQGEN